MGESYKPVVFDATYPSTEERPVASDNKHSKTNDPYRWLEQDTRVSEEVAKWAETQSLFARKYLDQLPGRDSIRERVKQLVAFPRIRGVSNVGRRWIFSREDGIRNFEVLFAGVGTIETLLNSPDEKLDVVLDVNKLSPDASVSLSSWNVSPNGKFVAYRNSQSGSDWGDLYFLSVDVVSGKISPLSDKLQYLKFSSYVWSSNSCGLFYSKYPAPKEENTKHQNLSKNHSIFFHRMGTPQSEDILVFSGSDHPTWITNASFVSDDRRFAFIRRSESASGRQVILVKDLHEPLSVPIPIYPDMSFIASPIGTYGDDLYFTDDGDEQGKGRIVRFSYTAQKALFEQKQQEEEKQENNSSASSAAAATSSSSSSSSGHSDNDNRASRKEPEGLKVVVGPDAENATLDAASLLGDGSIVASYLRDAKTTVSIFNPYGEKLKEFQTPGLGTVSFVSDLTMGKLFYHFYSFNVPPCIYSYDIWTGAHKPVFRPELPYDADKLAVEQHFVTNKKDGTRVPVFIVYHKELFKKDGSAPALLTAYGGFGISLTPSFSSTSVIIAEQGGIYVQANIRGGGEYGENWHWGGAADKKQNCFDDFISVSEWLSEQKYTQPSKLTIVGGSNGGLLVSAVSVQRPDLFGAVISRVPVADMLRFHKFTAGVYWIEEYGNPDNEDDCKRLEQYSPYHSVLRAGQKDYPSTLIMTADTDDRVVPSHAFKLAAAMQKNQMNKSKPVLARIELKAGHGAGTSLEKIIAQSTDVLSFVFNSANCEYKSKTTSK